MDPPKNFDLEALDSSQLHSFFRTSMHWEEYFGSSVDLTRAILSIYDKFATVSKDGQKNVPDQDKNSIEPVHLLPKSCEDGETVVTNTDTTSAHSFREDMPDAACDSRKRPLSISSMSSASSSSLPRHSRYKRLNMTDVDHAANGHVSLEQVNSEPLTDMDERFSLENAINDELHCADIRSAKTEDLTRFLPGNRAINKKSVIKPRLLVSGDGLKESSMFIKDGTSSELMNAGQNSSCLERCSLGHGNNLLPTQSMDERISPKELVAMPSPSPSPEATCYISYVQRVVTEIVETEKTYLKHLKEIKGGYLEYLNKCEGITKQERTSLFGNIVEIYTFNKMFLEELEHCEGDPLKVAKCFVKNNKKFVIYGNYCTNYPSAVETLTKCMKHRKLADIFKQRQLTLGHALPLGAYLLKPVQRVLKYHLLLQNIVKNFEKDKPGYDVLLQALHHMTSMAQHINEMKRKHEHAVRVQEIQSQLEEYDGEDLTTMGDLVNEGSLRVYGAKSSRQVFLFERALLITKKKEEGMLSCKGFIKCSNLMLVESIPKEPLSFQVIPYNNQKMQHTLQARTAEHKRKWCQEIKHLILESFKGKIPEKVKNLVMELGRSKDEEYATNNENVDPGKKSLLTIPQYMEKRGRVRRKSGNLISDLMTLKPQRLKKSYRKSDPGTPPSPPPTSLVDQNPLWNTRYGSPKTEGTKDAVDGKEVTASSQGEAGDNHASSITESNFKQNFERSSQNSTQSSIRRAQSFRVATRLHPLGSGDYTERVICPMESLPCSEYDEPKPSLHTCLDGDCSTTGKTCRDLNPHKNNNDCHTMISSCPKPVGKYASMPSLLDESVDPGSTVTNNLENHSAPNKKSADGRNLSEMFQTKNSHDNDVAQLVFSPDEVNSKSDVNLEANDLTLPGSFSQNSFKNLSLTSLDGSMSHKQFIPQSESLAKQAQQAEQLNQFDNPWVRKVDMDSAAAIKNSKQNNMAETKNKSVSPESLDWLVYLNRNSLPNSSIGSSSRNDNVSQQHRITIMSATLPREKTRVNGSVFSYVDNSINGECCSTVIQRCDVDRKKKPLARSMSTPTTKRLSCVDAGSRPQPVNTDPVQESERMVAEMESYMRNSSLDNRIAKFPKTLPNDRGLELRSQPSLSRQDSQLSMLSDSSQSSYESDLESTDNLVTTIRNKLNNYTARLESFRALSRSLQASTPPEPRPVSAASEADVSKNKVLDGSETKAEKVKTSLGRFHSLRAKVECHPAVRHQSLKLDRDVTSSLLNGKQTGSMNLSPHTTQAQPVVERTAYTLPCLHSHIPVSLSQFSGFISLTQPKYSTSQGALSKGSSDMSKSDLQPSDSAFSIQSEVTDSCTDDMASEMSYPNRSTSASSLVSVESIYEHRLSAAFDATDLFRDSAIYCDMDVESGPMLDCSTPTRATIKEYVHYLENLNKPPQTQVTGVKRREPCAMIRQRLQNLQENSQVKRCSKNYEELESLQKTFSNTHTVHDKMNEKKTYQIPLANNEYITQSVGQLDQVHPNDDSLTNMKGWVRQLISKFQSS